MHPPLGAWMNLLKLLSVRRMVSWCYRCFTMWIHQMFVTKKGSLGKHSLNMKKNLRITKRYKGGGMLYMKQPIYLIGITSTSMYLVITLVLFRVLMVLWWTLYSIVKQLPILIVCLFFLFILPKFWQILKGFLFLFFLSSHFLLK